VMLAFEGQIVVPDLEKVREARWFFRSAKSHADGFDSEKRKLWRRRLDSHIRQAEAMLHRN